ncbi:protein of unknown function [Azospirillum baldaniorum]|uniref:Uncharacterized protein n=1 Tax=Azospirillum baldaniorum TaxID=1064539 RepID=A0A9P1JT30_9PROT|nr:protein of unknown function [Azospirillum baldaniorum]
MLAELRHASWRVPCPLGGAETWAGTSRVHRSIANSFRYLAGSEGWHAHPSSARPTAHRRVD